MTSTHRSEEEELGETRTFYCQALLTLNASKVPYLVGGSHALAHYTGYGRSTKDLDIFVKPQDTERILKVLEQAGFRTEVTFTHWIGKAFSGEDLVDVIFSSGNGVCIVDDAWFEHAVEEKIFDVPAKLTAPEEMIWSKAFIMERDRFDGADIAHIIRNYGQKLDWKRLRERFGAHWRVLLSHFILYGFIYPSHRAQVPQWLMTELLGRLQKESSQPPPSEKICFGTLLSLTQYRIDTQHWGYQDARRIPLGNMSQQQIEAWTKAFEKPDEH